MLIGLVLMGLAIFALGFLTANFIFHRLYRNEIGKGKNPYINMHRQIINNDKNHKEYLEWLSKNGYGTPLDKIKHPAELKAEKKISTLFKD